jgi:hypothetical protein
MNDEVPKLDSSEEALTRHLRELEERLLESEVRRDRAQVSALLAEDFLEFGSSGRVWTRAEILDLLATETYTQPEMIDFACRRIAEGVALATYKTVRMDAGERTETLRSSLWTQKSGTWQVRFHQGTKVGNENREGKLKL